MYGATQWDLILERKVPRHVHPCPECYEHVPCTDECTIEPDLEMRDGTPSGSHEVCERCRSYNLANGVIGEGETPSSGATSDAM